MVVHVSSAVCHGPRVVPITVEVETTRSGLPHLSIIGLARSSVQESKDRVLSALRSCQVSLPRCRVTINLVPVDIPKSGSSLDLAIAVGLLAVYRRIPPPPPDWLFVGELALDGSVRSCAHIFSLCAAFFQTQRLVVPYQAQEYLAPLQDESSFLPESAPLAPIWTQHLTDLLPVLQKQACPITPSTKRSAAQSELQPFPPPTRLSRGLLRVLALSVVGGHHLLLFGSPGTGKTYAQQVLRWLIPPESPLQRIERLARADLFLGSQEHIATERVIAPHHTVTAAALLGGGVPVRPGLISLAHDNWLFLDEFPEFREACREGLRQPLESERVLMARGSEVWVLPCSCTCIATANPCPCGWYGTSRCHCTPHAARAYLQKLSGPVLDRFDVQWRVTEHDLMSWESTEAEVWREQVWSARRPRAARALHPQLCEKSPFPTVARNYSLAHCQKLVEIDVLPQELLQRTTLSWRRRIMTARLAVTLADLTGAEQVERSHLLEAEQFVFQRWGEEG